MMLLYVQRNIILKSVTRYRAGAVEAREFQGGVTRVDI